MEILFFTATSTFEFNETNSLKVTLIQSNFKTYFNETSKLFNLNGFYLISRDKVSKYRNAKVCKKHGYIHRFGRFTYALQNSIKNDQDKMRK